MTRWSDRINTAAYVVVITLFLIGAGNKAHDGNTTASHYALLAAAWVLIAWMKDVRPNQGEKP